MIPARRIGVKIRWRTLECLCVALALFLQTGAVSLSVFLDSYGNLSALGSKVMQLLALPVYLVALVILARHPPSFARALRRNLPLVMLLALPFLSVLWSISPSTSLRRAIGLDLSVLLAYAVAIRFSPRQILIVVGLVLGASMVLSLALMVVAPHKAFMPWSPELRGVFNHKNVLGWYAALGAIVGGVLATDRSLGLRPSGSALFAASAACLLLSQSATSLAMGLTALPFAVFYTSLARARPTGRLLLIVTALLLTAGLILSLDLVVAPLLEGAGKDATLTGRVPLWALVDQAIAQRPILGYGYQSFWTEGNGKAWEIWSRVAWPAPHAHNGYRDALLSFGVVGTALLLAVLARAVRQGAALHCRRPDEGWLGLNILVAVILVMNLTESTLLAQNSFIFTLFIAAAVKFSLHGGRS